MSEQITPIRVSMWAGPRNISTTMMRSFENRPDTAVLDEPFYAHYLKESGAQHPMRLDIMEALPQPWEDVVALLNGPAPAGAEIFFHKHIAYHAAESSLPLEWLEASRPFLLIRDPRAMVASYVKKYPDVAPIANSLKIQTRIHAHMRDKDIACPIVEASDILKNPKAMLKALCAALDIPFTEKMLSWPAGPRASDGIWGPHWYDAVSQSTGFKPYQHRAITLSDDLKEIADACQPLYENLRAQRLRAES